MLDALFAELGDGHGDARLAAQIGNLKAAFADTADIQYRARQLTEDVAIALQAKLLLKPATPRCPTPSSAVAWGRRAGLRHPAARRRGRGAVGSRHPHLA